ncbi:type IV toxin-antitoxin system AbiEi family antitoxin domain-containing protein [bacterium]|nr:type IV toxin-antitoxin system AbiEi family antitoxin domain-containing protein [bacterium]
MPEPANPKLTPGKVYRTRDLARWSTNPSRLAGRLVREGKLERLGHGLYAHEKQSRFGLSPPRDEELLRAFLGTDDFLVTGPERWNLLRLGTTAWFASRLVYNKKRSGRFVLDGRPFIFRRVLYPRDPAPEWFVVDLFENARSVGANEDDLAKALARAIREGRFDSERLAKYAKDFGARNTQRVIAEATVKARSHDISASAH